MRRSIILITLLSTGAFASSIKFQQDGWSVGGPLVVSFTGLDKNLDGTLMTDELTHFQARWNTPEGTPTQWGLSQIEPSGFIFTDPGNFLLFIRNSEYALVDTAFEGEFLATVFNSQLFPIDSTSGPAQVIPEPGTLSLLGVFSGAVVVISRLRRQPGRQ